MKTRIASFLGVLFLGVCPLLAAVDAFIKFDGVTGESHQPSRTGWIEIESWSFGASQAGAHSTGSGGGAGKVSVHDISITKRLDKTSATLAHASLTRKHFQTVTLDVKSLHYVFEDVVITSVQNQASMGDGSAREVIKMSYAREEMHDPPVDRSANPIGNAAVSTRLVTPIQPNATFGGGVSGGVMLQSLRLVGQTQAIIVVCDVAGGQTLAALQRASQSRQPMPTLSVRANAKQAGQPNLQFTFTNVLVSGYSMAPGGCSQVTLHFSKFDGPPSGY